MHNALWGKIIATCIMCFAVLSSLLNLIRGVTRESEVEASWETVSKGVPIVAMNLLEKICPTVDSFEKLDIGSI